MKHFSSKNVFRRGLYIDYIFTFFLGNNCTTILEIVLAAINDIKGGNLSKRNESVMRRFSLGLIKFW